MTCLTLTKLLPRPTALVWGLLDRGNDLTSYFWPSAYFIKQSILKSRTFPLWQPIFFSGIPLIGDPQNLSLYLPNILFLFLPINLAFFILLFGHLFFAAVSTFFLLKSGFKKSSLAGLVAAVAFVFSPKIFSHLEAGHYTMIVAFSWLPLLFLSFIKFQELPTLKKSFLISIILMVIFINYVNIFYFSFLFFLLWLFLNGKREVWKFLPLIVGVFFGLSAFQLLPQAELASLSNRSLLSFQDVAQPLWSFKLFFQSLIFPYFYGIKNFRTENLLFPGLVVGLLSLVGFFHLKKKQRLIFALWLIFSLLYSLGSRIPFFIFFYKFFPFIRFMRATTRLWIISNLLIAVMAGIGVDFLIKKLKAKRVGLFVIFFLLTELLFVGVSIFKRRPPASGLQATAGVYQKIGNDPELFRIYCTTDCLSIKEATKIGKPVLGGNNPVQLKDYVKFLAKAAGYQYDKYIPILPPYEVFPQKPQPDAELLGLLNTKYVLSPYPLEDKGFLLKEKMDEILIYENEKVLGQAFLEKDGKRTSLEVKNYSPNKIVVEFEPELEGRLVLSEIFYPGWQAQIDGRQVEINKIYEVLRSIKIPKGSKEAVFVYSPKSFKIGLLITSMTVSGIIVCFVIRSKR